MSPTSNPTLPTEMWSHVARFLSLSDAARLTGVNKATSRIELHNVILNSATHDSAVKQSRKGHPWLRQTEIVPAEGYMWACKRWATATVLRLDLDIGTANNAAWMGRLIHAASALSQLEGLRLQCAASDWYQAGATDQDVLNIILAHAPRLRVLHMACSSLKVPSSLGSLRHILLHMGGQHADSPLQALSTATNLESLRVWGFVRPYVLGDLDLSALHRLTAVSFRHVEPTLLLLPEQCRLSVVVGSLVSANLDVWKSVRRHLRSFWVVPIEDSPFQAGMAVAAANQLPAMLSEKGPPIQQVVLHVKSLGCSERAVSLGGALAGAELLYLNTEEDMHLMVPPDADWRFFLLDAGKQLRMDFEAGPSHFQGPDFPIICATYGTLSGAGLMELFRDRPNGLVWHEWEGDLRQAVYFAPLDAHRKRLPLRLCSCMACEECLERTAQLPEDWSRKRYQHYVD